MHKPESKTGSNISSQIWHANAPCKARLSSVMLCLLSEQSYCYSSAENSDCSALREGMTSSTFFQSVSAVIAPLVAMVTSCPHLTRQVFTSQNQLCAHAAPRSTNEMIWWWRWRENVCPFWAMLNSETDSIGDLIHEAPADSSTRTWGKTSLQLMRLHRLTLIGEHLPDLT